jgi:hypothetical protein
MRSLLIIALLSLASTPVLAQSVALVPGQSTAFTLPASAYTTALHFDVPAGATSIKVELESDSANVDLDLFLRQGNAFSSQTVYGRAMDFDALQAQAQYFAVSGGDEETIALGRSNYRPVRAGRWHLAVLNFATVPANARIKVELGTAAAQPVRFDVRFDLPSANCDVAPWNDSTPASPVGGNPGTTLGQQRRNAMIEALRQLGAGLDSETPITVRACWDALTVDSGGRATLAAASPDDFVIEDRSLVFADGSTFRPAAFLPESYAFYAAAPAARLAGTRACSLRGGDCANSTDMTIVYNRRIGETGVLGGARFYLGYDSAPAGSLDFVGVSVHELGHGLGFVSLVRLSTPVGAKPLGRDDMYSRQVVDNRAFPNPSFTRLTDAGRADVMTSLIGLSWIDQRAANFPGLPFTGFPGVLLYAPNPVQPGSSLSHLDSFYSNELMTPTLGNRGTRQLGVALPMLYAVGWDPAPTVFPTPPAPYAGLWYDRDRDAHGVDFQRVYTDAAGFDVYSLIFYTYDASGQPEWYIAIGPLVDGVFAAALDSAGNSLVRYRYVGGATPQQAVPGESGQIVLDFNKAGSSPACNDGTTRSGVGLLGVMRYTLAGVSDAWCMEELIQSGGRPEADLTGTWFAGNGDGGWGSSVATAAVGATQRLLFSTLYYPDSSGAGRWAFVSSADYQPGQPLPVFERRGYCRTCTASTSDVQIGTLTPTLLQPVQGVPGNNRFTFDVTYAGAQGGRFTRSNVPYELLSAPAQ